MAMLFLNFYNLPQMQDDDEIQDIREDDVNSTSFVNNVRIFKILSELFR